MALSRLDRTALRDPARRSMWSVAALHRSVHGDGLQPFDTTQHFRHPRISAFAEREGRQPELLGSCNAAAPDAQQDYIITLFRTVVPPRTNSWLPDFDRGATGHIHVRTA